jgi:copper chaperone CopZ
MKCLAVEKPEKPLSSTIKQNNNYSLKNQKIMKTKLVSIVMLMSLSSLTLFAGSEKTEKFKVGGKCGMCEARIEKAANAVSGVIAAEWDKETKMIEVTFNETVTHIRKVHEAIAEVGHDTEWVKADDETYASLPSCCDYERLSYDD